MISIIVPVLNEGAGIADFLQKLREQRNFDAEIILVDGGSTDETVVAARGRVDEIVFSASGRSRQMNAGAAKATGDVLLFLHADTELPDAACAEITQALSNTGRAWGRFDVRINSDRIALRLVAWLMNARSRWSGIATGDQAIFVRRRAFEQAGGFPDIALMEDVAFSKSLKYQSWPACIPAKVVTSGRRWEREGVLKTIFLMWHLRLMFVLGANTDRLAERYGYKPYRQHE